MKYWNRMFDEGGTYIEHDYGNEIEVVFTIGEKREVKSFILSTKQYAEWRAVKPRLAK